MMDSVRAFVILVQDQTLALDVNIMYVFLEMRLEANFPTHIILKSGNTVFFGVIRFFAKGIATVWRRFVTECRIVRHGLRP